MRWGGRYTLMTPARSRTYTELRRARARAKLRSKLNVRAVCLRVIFAVISRAVIGPAYRQTPIDARLSRFKVVSDSRSPRAVFPHLVYSHLEASIQFNEAYASQRSQRPSVRITRSARAIEEYANIFRMASLFALVIAVPAVTA